MRRQTPSSGARWARRALTGLGLASLALLASSCRSEDADKPILSARPVVDAYDLIGGPLAHGQVGDFLLENDEVRFIISGAHHSWGPGLFGGTVVDADLRRSEGQFLGGLRGNDQFAELFPTVNLLVADPTSSDVRVTATGADGKAAQITAEGNGLFYLDGLSLLDPKRSDFGSILSLFDVKTAYHFKTTYTLHPGTRTLEIDTEVARPESPTSGDPASCKDALEACTTQCAQYKRDIATGCFACECDEGRELPLFTESVPLLARILGDSFSSPEFTAVLNAGLVGGDFLFFGGSTDVFAPGLGFDVKGPIFDNFFRGVDTITNPLTFDWVAARGNNVSYAVYTKRTDKPATCLNRIVITAVAPDTDVPALKTTLEKDLKVGGARIKIGVGAVIDQRIPFAVEYKVADADIDAHLAAIAAVLGPKVTLGTEPDGACRDPKLLVPLFTSSATMLAGSGESCLADASDDATCDAHRVFRFKRFLVVGDGDISSVTEPIFKDRGIITGSVRGVVFDKVSGRAEASSDVFAIRDPDPSRVFTSYDELLKANMASVGTLGLENQALSDVGTDPTKLGKYRLTLPVGSYYLAARTAGKIVSVPQRVVITSGKEDIVHLYTEPPAAIAYRITDASGGRLPVKVTLQALGPDGRPLRSDGKRHVEMGDGRFDDGVFTIAYSATGEGTLTLQAGEYIATVSRGFEYSIMTKRFSLRAGDTASLTGTLQREVDTSGFISGDFHLHAEPSMDSGIDLGLRVLTNVVEGVELLSSSDHDAITDYRPKLLAQGLDKWATSQVGLEVSTLELGHTLAFPLKFNNKNIPVHGAVDWVCKSYDPIFRDARALGEFGADSTVLTVAHPRDGFLGYFDQFKLDPWTLERGTGGLEKNNPLFRTLSCDFDSMELFNGKRWELIHTPTTSEINDTTRCLREINTAQTPAAIRSVCTWLRSPPECATGAVTTDGNPCTWYENFDADTKDCLDTDSAAVCKDVVRNAVTKLSIRRFLRRTPEEQAAWLDADVSRQDADSAKCSPGFLDAYVACIDAARTADADRKLTEADYTAGCNTKLAYTTSDDPLADETIAPCAQHQGVAEDWFQLLNFGMNITAMGNSDSHGTTLEPGMPRNWIGSSSDDASRIDRAEIARNIKAMNTLPSTGPFVRVAINGAGMGQTVDASGGKALSLSLHIETPSWFGASRFEVYRNGAIIHAQDLDVPASQIVDFDGAIPLDTPTEDSWYVVAVMGLDNDDFMTPVYVTIALGDLGLDKITSLAFANLGVVGSFLSSEQPLPDYFPSIPYAMTNPIFVDVDGGGYKARLGPPPFCPVGCTPQDKREDGYYPASDCAPPAGITAPTDPTAVPVVSCFPNEFVGRLGAGGTCGKPILGECGIGFLAERAADANTVKGALTVEGSVPGLPEPAMPKVGMTEAEASLHTRGHATGRYIWNAFVHGFHVHHERH